MIRIFIIFWVVLVVSVSVLAGPLSKVEKQILAHIDQAEPDAVNLLEKVVNINSGTMNFNGVKKVGDAFSDEYRKLGFSTTWIDGAPFNRAGHLVASYGNSGVRLLLIGHLDTVFAEDSPLQRYHPVSENKVMGPGITDMKGGDVVLLYALKSLHDTGVLDQFSVRVVLTGDEEKRGRPLDIATSALIDAGIWADIAIGFEDGDGDPKTAVISRRSASGWQLDVTGRPAHSSQIFREGYGVGAIYEAARILNQFRETLAGEPNLTFNPGLIVGGTQSDLNTALARGSAFGKNNVIAKTTRVVGDIRALTPEQLARSQAAMKKIVANNLNETTASIRFLDGYPPMAPSDGNRRLLAIYNQISHDLSMGEVSAVDPRKAGAADISFVAEHVEMAMDGLGLMGSGGHTVDETADMSTLKQQTKRAALLFYRLSQTK
ncbi:MAG: M20/M25/M40 family metallo-hydrolase [Gammaproteobacteria bacterium]|nr:M20/M25/M40 family metallo-hydrolase [Gammaproteobacteria bacterium]